MSALGDRLATLTAEQLAVLSGEARDRLRDVPAEPIAIVGIGCRFPGGVHGAEAFWELLASGRDAVTEVPPSRWDIERYYDPRPGTPGKMYTRHGGFVDEVECFDADFFGISPREAAGMDPQQRLLLETAWQALDEAGAAAPPRRTSAVGVYIGIMNHDYAMLLAETAEPDSHTGSGNGLSVAAGRLSHCLDLHGPALAVDTACSSSLVTVHLACRALRAGEAELALAGGVNLILSPTSTIVECEMRMLAADGRCKAFDAGADGFVRGEGCGVVALKRLSDALRDGDRIRAVIRGSAVNHDGRSGALTVPNGPAQERVITAALRDGGVAPEQVAFVEAHGTGTALGDPIEVRALARAYGCGPERPLAIGSVKTNLGHTESAAGIAGILKAVLALEHATIPPHLHLETPSPDVPWDQLGIRVPCAPEPWPAGAERRLAGVSSFGFSGTNAHVVLEAAPTAHGAAVATAPDAPPYLLALSASSEEALRASASDLARALDGEGDASLPEICGAVRARRSHMRHRAVLTVDSIAQARDDLEGVADGAAAAPGVALGTDSGSPPRLAWLFTGNGSQYPGMGRTLLAHEPARDVLARCAAVAAETLSQPLLDVLTRDGEEADLLDRADYAQPALYALQCALAALWRSWGVEPQIVAGHSTGEYAAAHVAGVFDLETGMRLMLARGRLLCDLPGDGGMLTCFADLATVSAALASRPALAIAALNATRNIVVAGPRAQLDDLAGELSAGGVGCRALRVDRAFHSPATEPILEPFAAVASTCELRAPALTVVSSVTGGRVSGELATAAYWTRHIRQPVRFAAALETVLGLGPDVCLEVGPTATLVSLAAARAAELELAAAPRLVASLRKGSESHAILDAAAALVACGTPLESERLGSRGGRGVVLPRYPFARRRHWAAEPAEPAGVRRAGTRAAARGAGAGHPLLGDRLRLAGGERRFEAEIGPHRPAFISDHKLHGNVVLPGAALIVMMLAAAESAPGQTLRLAEVRFMRPIVFGESGLRTVQTVVGPDGTGRARIEIFVLPEAGEEPRFVLAAVGEAVAGDAADVLAAGAAGASAGRAPDATEGDGAGQELDVDAYYAHFLAGGLEYGPAMRCITRLTAGPGWSRAELALPAGAATQDDGYAIHPAILDAGLQAIGAALPEGDQRPWVPAAISAVSLGAVTAPVAGARVRVEGDPAGAILHAEVELTDALGVPVARLEGVRLMPLAPGALNGLGGAVRDALYEVRFVPRVRSFPALPLALPAPAEVAAALAPRLAALARNEALAGYRAAIERVDAEARATVTAGLARMGWAGEPSATAELRARLGIDARYERLLPRLLAIGAIGAGGAGGASGNGASTRPPDRAPDDLGEQLPDARVPVEGELVRRCGARLDEVLRGEIDPLELLFPEGDATTAQALYEHSPGYGAMNGLVREAVAALVGGLRPGAGVRVLEVGAGTGGTTAHVLPVLPADACEYVFSDISQHFLTAAKRRFGEYPFLRTAMLDLDIDPLLQGQHGGRYDLVIASNVIHGTTSLRDTLARLRTLLAPGGRLVLAEATRARPWLELTFGLTDGWWAYEDPELRSDGPLVSLPGWIRLLHEADFDQVAPILDDGLNRDTQDGAVVIASAPAGAVPVAAPHLILLPDAGGVAERVAELAARRGQRCTLAAREASSERHDVSHWAALLADGGDDRLPTEVVDLTGLDLPRGEDIDLEAVQDAIDIASGRALALLPALIERTGGSAQGLTFVTAGAQAARPSDRVPDLGGALLSGLAAAIEGEHPAVRCRAVDLEETDPSTAAAMLLDELTVAADLEPVAFRAGRRLAPRLVRWPVPDTVTDGAVTELSPEGVYLITGGLRGLGLLTAGWAVQRGARRLLLAGRSAAGPDARTAIAELQARGADVSVCAADLGHVLDVEHLRAELGRLDAPLRGIFHAAGALSDGVLGDQDREGFELPFGAKVIGSWRLAELALASELDLFVLYSSAVSLLGNPGQANHHAACAFEDALAHHLRARGVPATSINWGAWSDVGAAADPALLARLQSRGMSAIAPDAGFAALDLLLQADRPQAAVIPIDWPTVIAGLNGASVAPILSTLVASELDAASSDARPGRNDALLATLAQAPPADVERQLRDYVLAALGTVLGRELATVDADRSLPQLGLDSLLAMELRNRILSELELDVALERLIEGITPSGLAAELAAILLVTLPAAPADADSVYEEFAL
jgi:acyl transferase domain-containing protein/SAM-dependent methyltransferase